MSYDVMYWINDGIDFQNDVAGVFCIIFRCFSILHHVNSKSLWCIKHGKDQEKANSFDVGLDLAHSLVMPFIQQRSLVGLRKPLLKNKLHKKYKFSSKTVISREEVSSCWGQKKM